MTCVRKQINIYNALSKTQTHDYMWALSFLAEMQRDVQDIEGAIVTFRQVVTLQDSLLTPGERLDQVSTLKLLAEELIKNDQIEEGIEEAKRALDLQKDVYKN